MLVRILRCRKREKGRAYSEDAAGGDALRGVFAVADGAGTGSYARQWASVLVDYAVNTPLRSDAPAEVSRWLNRARRRFVEVVPPVDPMSVPPHQRATLQRGAFATFHQIRFRLMDVHGQRLAAQCLSLGDTCVFLRRAGSNQTEMHPEKIDLDFDRAPHLMTTSAAEFNPYVRTVEACELVDLYVGDRLIAATDAVARWIVAHRDDGVALDELLSIPNDERWRDWVEARRDARTIGNDDCTLMLLQVDVGDLMLGQGSDPDADSVREQELFDALSSGDSIEIAEAWGDGAAIPIEQRDVLREQVKPHLKIFEALQHMRSVLNSFYQESASIDDVRQEWDRWRVVLANAPAGAGMRRMLQSLGFPVDGQETN